MGFFFFHHVLLAMLTLRAATRDDASIIVELINALADYENAPPSLVKTTEENILKYGFGANPSDAGGGEGSTEAIPPRFHCIIAEWNKAAAGFALYFYNFSTWEAKHGIYLEDLFVLPAFRKHGIGKALLQRLAQIAVEQDCARLVWQVLDWNQLAIDFYENIGAKKQGEWLTYRMEADAIRQLAAQSHKA
jgi:GNAT superfamily N-acetyltransferase